MLIRGKVFIVTGGASGLGAAVADMLIGEGGKVVIADLAADPAADTTDRIHIRADVTLEADGEGAAAAAVARFGQLHGLVNCAGIAPSEKLVGREAPHRLESFSRAISINLVGSFNMMRLAAAQIAKSEPDAEGERGVIINTASIAAFDGQIGQVAYAASKGGVVAMTLPAARELARHGIRVACIAPGIFETPMMGAMPQEVQEALGKAVPFPPRMGRPAEYAGLVRHICENSMLNGEVIRLDGALRMAAR
ncbi:SDR family NAD(P)-dependent oxidoreductase [Rhizobium oryzicola]|uniref:SDR family NAD(P)-dependent oxidoreductase n=1 Tax=Rhizobium oryzicola TaxID=1232668 RepID=A0ABT8T3Z6_9HYPH|nr:SDR family NAD(P)-dependent oxidoreductase [Rhizobium oryzicola]MDO1585372.1 SDR family NAD(P)-dependent oxidoreductase [Rhizobium oryzicola]